MNWLNKLLEWTQLVKGMRSALGEAQANLELSRRAYDHVREELIELLQVPSGLASNFAVSVEATERFIDPSVYTLRLGLKNRFIQFCTLGWPSIGPMARSMMADKLAEQLVRELRRNLPGEILKQLEEQVPHHYRRPH